MLATVGPGTVPSSRSRPRAPPARARISPRDTSASSTQARMAALSAGVVAADASAQVQSGEALRVRSRDFDARAAKFAMGLEDYERRTLSMLAGMLNQPGPTSLTYPRRYTLPDSSEDLARAVLLLQSFWDELGLEGKSQVVRQALNAGLSLSDQDVDTIMAEVRASLEPDPQTPRAGVPFAKDPAVRPGLPVGG